MDPRPPPPVTIEGGPGWQLGSTPGDVLAGDEERAEPAGGQAGRGRRLGALVVAAALGFAAATALAERRQSALDDSPAGVLSLDAAGSGPLSLSPQLVSSAAGAPALVSSVVLRNTGPRPVALESAELLGTGYRAEDVADRRIAPQDRTTVRLLRPVRCDEPGPAGPPGPLRVRAMTGAGPRTADLRVDASDAGSSEELARAACGQASPVQSLLVMEPTAAVLEGARASVTAELSNTSASRILLQTLRVPPGLRIVAMQDGDGVDVPLPLVLPPGDYDPPTDPHAGRGPARVLVVVLEVSDCAALRPQAGAEPYLPPLFQARVTDAVGGSGERHDRYRGLGSGSSAWGDPSIAARLHATACPSAAGAGAQVPPVPAARPGSPFFTPD